MHGFPQLHKCKCRENFSPYWWDDSREQPAPWVALLSSYLSLPCRMVLTRVEGMIFAYLKTMNLARSMLLGLALTLRRGSSELSRFFLHLSCTSPCCGLQPSEGASTVQGLFWTSHFQSLLHNPGKFLIPSPSGSYVIHMQPLYTYFTLAISKTFEERKKMKTKKQNLILPSGRSWNWKPRLSRPNLEPKAKRLSLVLLDLFVLSLQRECILVLWENISQF